MKKSEKSMIFIRAQCTCLPKDYWTTAAVTAFAAREVDRERLRIHREKARKAGRKVKVLP